MTRLERVHPAEYAAWGNMKNRCLYKSYRSYHRYGGRGIRVCDRWRHSFENFLADVGPRPSPQHSLDRYPNNDGNYEPGNVRWATRAEQQHSRPKFFLDLTGKTFNFLTVVSFAGNLPINQGKVGWHCVCRCGEKVTVIAGNLVSGNQKSCGCISRNRLSDEEMAAEIANGMDKLPRCDRCRCRAVHWSQKHSRYLKVFLPCSKKATEWLRKFREKRASEARA